MKIFRCDLLLAREGQEGTLREQSRTKRLVAGSLATAARRAILRARRRLLAEQRADGSWAGPVEGNSALESQAILLDALLGGADGDMVQRAARRLFETQSPQGGWAIYPGGPPDVSLSVQAYFALKLSGQDPGSEHLYRARQAILAQGGADAADGLTRFWMAVLGQIPYGCCPAVPPQLAIWASDGLLERLDPLGTGGLGAWSRTLLVALSIVFQRQLVHRIDPRRGVRELFVAAPERWRRCGVGDPERAGKSNGKDRFSRLASRLLTCCHQRHVLPLGGRAIRAAKAWLLRRPTTHEGDWSHGPAITWTLVALRALGYADGSPEASRCRRQLEASIVVQRAVPPSIRVQPCQLPVADTAVALRALRAGGLRNDSPAIFGAAGWLLARQTRGWAETRFAGPTLVRLGGLKSTLQSHHDKQSHQDKSSDVRPGGWSATGRRRAAADADTSALVLLALQDPIDPPGGDGKLPPDLRLFDGLAETGDSAATMGLSPSLSVATGEALGWLLARQNDDGGWGTGERRGRRGSLLGGRRRISNDASTPDSTGRVLEALGNLGMGLGNPAVDRAAAYLRRRQEPDGSWFGRWGVNYVYGTWQVLAGLARIGLSGDDPSVAAGANWLLSRQQPCGGWGESPESYADPRRRGQGEPTASQTAWALMGLLAAGLEAHPAASRAVQYLVDTQSDNGVWAEEPFTGTGLPGTIYLRHHYYPLYFPLMAISQWVVTASATQATVAAPNLRIIMPPDEIGRPQAAALYSAHG
jgi:squalene-hopene/tetraprenyl-beta-curcumene cyclase